MAPVFSAQDPVHSIQAEYLQTAAGEVGTDYLNCWIAQECLQDDDGKGMPILSISQPRKTAPQASAEDFYDSTPKTNRAHQERPHRSHPRGL
jgi:hypothetical protein